MAAPEGAMAVDRPPADAVDAGERDAEGVGSPEPVHFGEGATRLRETPAAAAPALTKRKRRYALQEDGPATEIEVVVKYKAAQHPIRLPSSALVADLQTRVAEATGVQPALQRLLFKGQLRPEATLAEAGLGNHAKVMLVGSDATDVQSVQAAEARYRHVLATRVTVPRARPRGAPTVSALGVRILRIEVLPGLPEQNKAREILERLAADNGIRNILQKHDWTIGVLRELSPLERTILGYNRNRGMEIALRLRGEDFHGFRPYHMVKSVMLHELTHMVHSEHDNNFYMFNRQLEKEAVALDWTKSAGHRLGGSEVSALDRATVDEDSALVGGTYTLGGDRRRMTELPSRDLLLQAALIRLTAEERLVSESCGTAPPPPPDAAAGSPATAGGTPPPSGTSQSGPP